MKEGRKEGKTKEVTGSTFLVSMFRRHVNDGCLT
jgi:hypothetical protein